jgi:formate dehydrogenase iron-sulfur subunit
MSEAATAAAPDLLGWLLNRERDMTAVERYARAHDRGTTTDTRWRELIPLTAPGPGEQYAFDVDLDACTGCKACVTACHNLNGLDRDETWRAVGLLSGGSATAPYQQHVTAACHHCVDPACLAGCPVLAYEKDPITGIVRHLDDQCIGCQYCTLTCPYDVPQYSPSRGIVRKCDMCRGRLAVGEAPACVQACPTEAIRITVVATEQVIADNEAGRFLPGAADPGITQPTTVFRSERAVPRNALPVDWYRVDPERAHPPLTAMLVLTQLAVGAFVVGALTPLTSAALAPLGRVHAVVALVIGLLALGASTLHLGRPLYAFRAVLGVRRSWLSREVIAFGGFAALASLYAAVAWWMTPPRWLAIAVSGVGLIGVGCSIMVYVATRRDGWRADLVAGKFLLGTALLGLVATLALVAVGAPRSALANDLAVALIIAAGLKLALEAALFAHIGDRRHGALKRGAVLMLGPLRGLTAVRFATGLAGGVALPLLYMASGAAWIAPVAALACLVGELIERHLFFVAAGAPRMSGGAA